MATTYTLIASSTVGSGGVSSIDFTSIPSTYTDLKLVLSLRGNVATTDDYVNIRFNSSSGANYSNRYLQGDGTASGSAQSGSFTAQTYNYAFQINGANATASSFGNVELYIPNYLASTGKSSLSFGAAESNVTVFNNRQIALNAGLWNQTAAITSINLSVGSSTLWVQYSTAYLYGISNA
jgi:hypothetical protein